jgi:hypothetical protein
VVSWAHQRTRELADQLLDDAYNVRQRGADLAGAVGRAVANAAAATRDAAWVVGDTLTRPVGRRDHGGSPLGPVAPLAVLRATGEREVAWDD